MYFKLYRVFNGDLHNTIKLCIMYTFKSFCIQFKTFL